MTGLDAVLPQSSFSTDLVPPEHRFEAWRSALASSHALEAAPDGFFGTVQSTKVDSVIVHRLDSAPVALERSTTRIRRDGLDHLILHFSRHLILASAAGRPLEIAAGSISINDLSQPTLRRPAAETASLVAVIPRGLMREAIGDCNNLHGRVLQGGAAALLSAHLDHLVANAPNIPESAGPALARATANLTAACLEPNTRTLGEAAPAIEAASFARARAFIEANLTRRELTPEVIGRAVGLSRSALFRVFVPHGGVSAYVWSRRLGAVRRALQDTDDPRSITQLSFDYGFSSGSHLSHAFRRAFGHSPREVQNEGRERTQH